MNHLLHPWAQSTLNIPLFFRKGQKNESPRADCLPDATNHLCSEDNIYYKHDQDLYLKLCALTKCNHIWNYVHYISLRDVTAFGLLFFQDTMIKKIN